MLKGLALTPPVVGRIAIGKVVVRSGKRLPEKDDEFTITSQIQGKDGWVDHPLNAQLRGEGQRKLRAIPVRLLFDDPDINLRANYTLFDRGTGRPLCVGDGATCRRVVAGRIQQLECPSPQACDRAVGGACKPYGRLHVRIDVEEDDSEDLMGVDGLGSFVFRTTGFNSIRTLGARLRYLDAASGGLLAALPLQLRLRGKSTTQSHRAPIFYVDLTLRPGVTLAQAMEAAREQRAVEIAAGIVQSRLDEAARQGLAMGAFEESEEEGASVVQEFYPEPRDQVGQDQEIEERSLASAAATGTRNPAASAGSLRDKLQRRVATIPVSAQPSGAKPSGDRDG